MGKVIELLHVYENELAAEIEELEVLLALARACQASAAILENPTTKDALRAAVQAVLASLDGSGMGAVAREKIT